MRKGIFLIGGIILLFNTSVKALNENKKIVKAVKTETPPKIDGVINEPIWQKAAKVGNFIQFEPLNGLEPAFPTDVKIVYDNHAIYFAAMLYDNNPDSIIKEMVVRDDFRHLNADMFSVIISTFNDGVNAVEFSVSAAGVQADSKYSGGSNPDYNWDAVWDSKIKITEWGWAVEMKIPYSALRFSKNENQDWGIQFTRQIRRYRQLSTWNFVDINVKGKINQMGKLSGIQSIQPPLRLSVTPYLSTYLQNDADGNKWNSDFNAGMDLKWGINQSFTLDMILIPDFGQVESDDEVLNLSPYEVKYNEKRQFFTEGTELFNKANIFYSRRIGGRPKNADDVDDNLENSEILDKNPAETQLINATKISGRTHKGLGVGFLNAMTGAVNAEIIDTIAGNNRHYQTQGFTNYNMLVLDQSLKNNSYASLVNTNVLHAEENYTANVTGAEINLKNKENSYQLFANGAVSQKYTDSTSLGHKYFLKFAKTKGKFLFELWHNTESDTYDPNDMGYIRQNNESTWDAELAYNINEPFWRFISLRNEMSFRHTSLYKPRKYSDFNIHLQSHGIFKNYISAGLFFDFKPFNRYDYFEPRVDGWKYNRHKFASSRAWFSTDYRKTLAFDIGLGGWKAMDYNQFGYSYSIEPRIRISDKWLIKYKYDFNSNFNTYGYIEDYTEEVIPGALQTIVNFGKRDQKTITNTFNTSYIFNNKMSLSIRARHYWSRVEYSDFYNLKPNGILSNSIGYNTYGEDENYNYNAFTIDMKYLWRFAPGSEMALVWKNSIYTDQSKIVNDFFNNFDNTIHADQVNSLSLKILYYLDYQYLIRN